MKKNLRFRSTVLVLALSFWPFLVIAQDKPPELFQQTEQPTRQWTAKANADIEMVPIEFNSSVLRQLETNTLDRIAFQATDELLNEIEIQRVIKHPDGSWSVTGHVNDNWENTFTLSVSEDRVLASIHNMDDHQFFEIKYFNEIETHVLVKVDPHQRDRISCGVHDREHTIIDSTDSQSLHAPLESSGSAVIDVMIVYTRNAENWANSRSSGINNVINQAMAIAQVSADNSRLNLTFRLVHRARVNYNETGDSDTDLDNLTFGVISNVRSLRNQYGADVVVMLTDTNDSGGIAWLLTTPFGNDSYAYSIARVQQASWTNTLVHEIGHNMGNAHSRNQRQAAAGFSGGFQRYSTGWRWTGTNSRSYASVMTYPEGSQSVDIFSNPDINYQGWATGSYSGTYAPADNARSMREVMHITADYRPTRFSVERPSVSTSAISSITSSSAIAGGNVTSDGGATVTNRGVCWSRSQDPNLNDNCLIRGSGTGSFNTTISALNPDSRYYVRAYAENSAGVRYGNQRDFTTLIVPADPNRSSIAASKDRVQANDQELSTITVTARDQNGNPLSGYNTTIVANSGNLRTDDNRKRTNADGQVSFDVTNTIAETVVYSAIIEGVNINSTATVSFIPVAPVALAASDVENCQFTSNWEMVSTANGYILDVSTGSSYADFVPGYQSLETGNVTSQVVSNLSPGTDYYYRLRAQSRGLIGANSESIFVTTFPEIPIALAATNRNALEFTANWQSAEGARSYLLDVSRSADFESFVPGYESTNVSNEQSHVVNGLSIGTDYYYRVRSKAGNRISASSSIIQTSTLSVSSENSDITSDQLRILANGDQSNVIEIIVRSEERQVLENLQVELIAEDGSSEIEKLQPVTDDTGLSRFSVTNIAAETVTYDVQVESISIGEVTVEFLEDKGILELGSNFPNPFRQQTNIPVSIPEAMDIKLTIYDSLGRPVKTLTDKSFESGYYEIPFEVNELAAGIYFYRLETGTEIKTDNMALIK